MIERCPHPRLGVCLDSCHLFASGIEITRPGRDDGLSRLLDATIGLDRLRALHLNDSQVPFGSNRDRHATVGEGLIGEGLAAFLGHPRLQGLPCVLETPGRGRQARSTRPVPAPPPARLHERRARAATPGSEIRAITRKASPPAGSKNSGLTQPSTSERCRYALSIALGQCSSGSLRHLSAPNPPVGGRRLELLEVDARREDALTAGRVQAAVAADLREQVGAALLETARRVHDAVAVDGARAALRAVLETGTAMRRETQTSTIES